MIEFVLVLNIKLLAGRYAMIRLEWKQNGIRPLRSTNVTETVTPPQQICRYTAKWICQRN